MKIIKPSRDDLTELADLQKRYMEYHKEIDVYFTFSKEMSELWIGHMERVLQDEDQIVISALVDGSIVGYMTASMKNRPPVYEIERVGLIGDAYVLPEHKRERVFTRLLDEFLAWMKKKGVEYMEHSVASKNKLGLEVWRRSGFEDSLVVMRKKI